MALLLLKGCAPKAAGPEVETVGDMVFVHNPALPLQPDLRVEFVEELVIGGEETAGDAMLYQPSDILVDGQGFIHVSDYRDAVIKVFDPEGRYVRTIGRKGEGPGEFQSLLDMTFLEDERLLVLDLRARRSSLFDRGGDFLQSHPWKNSHFQILFTDETGYLCDENLYGSDPKLLVNKLDFKGNELENWGEFTPVGFQTKRVGDSMLSITIPHTPHSIFAGDPARKRLYHCLNDTYLIEVYEPPGKLVRKIDRPYQKVPFTQKDTDEYYAGVDRRQNPQFSEMARDVELPKVKTISENMLVDDRGNLWVATHELDESGEESRRAWDIFNPDGHYLTRLWLTINPGGFRDGKMYRLHSDEATGFRTVRRYSVTWSD